MSSVGVNECLEGREEAEEEESLEDCEVEEEVECGRVEETRMGLS